jgi:hypothetical protein
MLNFKNLEVKYMKVIKVKSINDEKYGLMNILKYSDMNTQ